MRTSAVSKTIAILICLFSCPALTMANVSMPAIFGTDMVLQRGRPVPVWGKAAPGEAVTVKLADQTKRTQADAKGNWRVDLDTMKAGGPFSMTVTGKNTLTFSNVMIGEVWICSGQSNMEWPLHLIRDGEKEIAAANNPQLRLAKIRNASELAPAYNCTAKWRICSPKVARHFSAVAYFYGQDLQKNLGVAVGLIVAAWGGTPIEAWMPEESLLPVPSIAGRFSNLTNWRQNTQTLLDEFHKKHARYHKSRIALIAREDEFAKAQKLADIKLPEGNWKKMELPGNWETRGLKGHDGLVWFQKEITVPDAWAGKDLELNLGAIDEVDVTWFNGMKVGNRGSFKHNINHFWIQPRWNQPRKYIVPGKQVKAGKNTITIAVFDQVGHGGLWGQPAAKMFVCLKDNAAKASHKPISLAGRWQYKKDLELVARPLPCPHHPTLVPTVLYNGMINPVVPYAIRGAIWYQGESNVWRACQYRQLMPALISSWREKWGQGDFPFIQTQLANFLPRKPQPGPSVWAELREAQSLATKILPNSELAVTIDIGETHNIHPNNKRDVGKRLALVAKRIAYGMDVVDSGPRYDSMNIVGNKAYIKFKHATGLTSRGKEPKGFAIAGKDQKFVWAKAAIKGDTIMVWSDKINHPVAVRYGWAANPEVNIYNQANLPAEPFRTDNWPVITRTNK